MTRKTYSSKRAILNFVHDFCEQRVACVVVYTELFRSAYIAECAFVFAFFIIRLRPMIKRVRLVFVDRKRLRKTIDRGGIVAEDTVYDPFVIQGAEIFRIMKRTRLKIFERFLIFAFGKIGHTAMFIYDGQHDGRRFGRRFDDLRIDFDRPRQIAGIVCVDRIEE